MEKLEAQGISNQEIRVYKKRWLILLIFFLYSTCSLLQITEYTVIADLIVKYYSVTYLDVYWTGMILMVLYVVCNFPCCYLIDKLGLRKSVLIGLLGTSIGMWIKLGSISPDRYWAVLLGQAIGAVFQVFVLPMPPKIAAVWFGAKQVSLACSIGLFSIAVGTAVGFLIPPFLVKQGDSTVIQNGLFLKSAIYAGFTTFLLPIMYFLFDDAPPTPPSIAQIEARKTSTDFKKSFKIIMSNKSFLLLTVSYGITVGIFYLTCSNLNQTILTVYPNAATDVGIVGLLMNLVGAFGLIACGFVLDRFALFKKTTLIISCLCLITGMCFYLLIDQGLAVVYITSSSYGFFLNGIFCVGYEMAVELTYPASESTSGGMLTAAAQACGILFVYFNSYLEENFSQITKKSIICLGQIIAVILIFCIKFDLKRQAQLCNKRTLSLN